MSKKKGVPREAGTASANWAYYFDLEDKKHAPASPEEEKRLFDELEREQDAFFEAVFCSRSVRRSFIAFKEELLVYLTIAKLFETKRELPSIPEVSRALGKTLPGTRIAKVARNVLGKLHDVYKASEDIHDYRWRSEYVERARAMKSISQELRRVLSCVDAARNKIAETYVRLVVYIAKDFYDLGLSNADVIQAGNLGLLTAIGKHDFKSGRRLVTTAGSRIKATIIAAISGKIRPISLSNKEIDMFRAVHRAKKTLFQKLQREPTHEEIAEKSKTTTDEVLAILAYSKPAFSLDGALGKDGDGPTGKDILAAPEKLKLSSADRERLLLAKAAIRLLPDTERNVVEMLYGLGTDGVRYDITNVEASCGMDKKKILRARDRGLRRIKRFVLERPDVLKAMIDPKRRGGAT